MVDQRLVRRTAVGTVLTAILLSAACAQAREPAPRPAASPLSTIARAEIGDALTVTASVDGVVSDVALVVRDVDLTDGALLVLTRDATPVSPPQLITVDGTIIRFSFHELADTYQLGDQGWYQRFEGQKALAADQVTVW